MSERVCVRAHVCIKIKLRPVYTSETWGGGVNIIL